MLIREGRLSWSNREIAKDKLCFRNAQHMSGLRSTALLSPLAFERNICAAQPSIPPSLLDVVDAQWETNSVAIRSGEIACELFKSCRATCSSFWRQKMIASKTREKLGDHSR